MLHAAVKRSCAVHFNGSRQRSLALHFGWVAQVRCKERILLVGDLSNRRSQQAKGHYKNVKVTYEPLNRAINTQDISIDDTLLCQLSYNTLIGKYSDLQVQPI